MRLFLSLDRARRFLWRRRDAYRAAFGGASGRTVLLDLTRFCGAFDSSHVRGNGTETAFNEGQRNVWLYIARQLGMTDAELIDLARQLTEENDPS